MHSPGNRPEKLRVGVKNISVGYLVRTCGHFQNWGKWRRSFFLPMCVDQVHWWHFLKLVSIEFGLNYYELIAVTSITREP